MSGSALVLFDIDGTLLRRSGPHHKKALLEAIRLTLGLSATFDGIATQGMLDRDLLQVLLRNAGCSKNRIRRSLRSLIDASQRAYFSDCPADLRDNVCPGVVPLLENAREKGAILGIVSGNWEEIGWKKLELAGLRPFFQLGAFANHGTTRTLLARKAIRQARKSGLISSQARISLIGDHENDVFAAKANGIQAVAVATGLSDTAKLAQADPHILLNDLSELVIETLL